MENAGFDYIIKRLADELQDNLKKTEFIKKKVEGLVNEVASLRWENASLKEENDILKKYAAMLLGEYGYNTEEGLNRVIDAISNKEEIISDWNKNVELDKEVGEI